MACFVACAHVGAVSLEVRDVLWGFDGHVVPEKFNMISVLVVNPSTTPFDGTVSLQKVIGVGRETGAPYVREVYVSPLAQRWVQFFPFIGDSTEWRLAWGRAPDEGMDLQRPSLGPPAQVLLRDPDTLQSVASGFRTFPENLFPVSAACADGLHSILLDHVPRWTEAKRQCLADWLRAGGTLHLLRDVSGQWPVFGEEWEALDSDAPSETVGSGRIVRHDCSPDELTPSSLERMGMAPPRLVDGKRPTIWRSADAIFPALARQAQPKHAWGAIGFLTLTYVLVIGPGIFLAARLLNNYRRTLGILLAVVVCYSGLFVILGRRGHGESAQIYSIAHARSCHNGHYLLTQWINLFVTRGDYYTIHNNGGHNLYALPQDYERVSGFVNCGKDGALVVDMPLFSQRNFMHQAYVSGPDLGIQVTQWPRDGRLGSGVIKVGADFPKKPLKVWAVYNGSVWPMRLSGQRLDVVGRGEKVSEFLGPGRLDTPGVSLVPGQEKPPPEQVFRGLAPVIMAWGLGGSEAFSRRIVGPASDGTGSIRLFILAPSPQDFFPSGARARRLHGGVLYSVEVAPEGTQGDDDGRES